MLHIRLKWMTIRLWSDSMIRMTLIKRHIENRLYNTLKRSKSILLLGPRQTGKTTLASQIPVDRSLNLMNPRLRQHYESHPDALINEITQLHHELGQKCVLIFIDEIQKCPSIMDAIQLLIDTHVAQFVLTGSSVRQLTNLLPGRVIKYTLGPYSQSEFPSSYSLETLLINGSLPGIFPLSDPQIIQEELQTYVSTYLEEEIRKEALVRNIGAFSNFLTLACIESGKLVSFRKFSEDIGVSHTSIAEYYRILEQCMIVERFEPITTSHSRRRLTKSPKYIIFDLGIRRVGASEGTNLSQERMGHLFEQWVGLELKKVTSFYSESVHFWRNHNGPEVEWVIKTSASLLPIEVKWTAYPKSKDISHINTFMDAYPNFSNGFVVCNTETPYQLSDRVTAIPWQSLIRTVTEILENETG